MAEKLILTVQIDTEQVKQAVAEHLTGDGVVKLIKALMKDLESDQLDELENYISNL